MQLHQSHQTTSSELRLTNWEWQIKYLYYKSGHLLLIMIMLQDYFCFWYFFNSKKYYLYVGLVMIGFVGFEFILLVIGSERCLVSPHLHLFVSLLLCCLLLKGLLFFKKFVIIILNHNYQVNVLILVFNFMNYKELLRMKTISKVYFFKLL